MTTTFKTFLIEKSNRKIITLDAAATFVAAHCMQAFENKNKIYRGINESNSVDATIVDPMASTTTRVSANTTNYYNSIISSSSLWRQFPPRNKSLICSSSKMTASSYGNVRIVFPMDSSIIGVCSTPDFWGSFAQVKSIFPRNFIREKSMSSFNDFLASVFIPKFEELGSKRLKDIKNIANDSSPEAVKKQFEFVDRVLGTYSSYKEFKEDTKVYEEDAHERFLLLKIVKLAIDAGSTYQAIENLFDPVKNKLKSITISQFDTVGSDIEVWTAGKSVLVNIYELDEFNKLVNLHK